MRIISKNTALLLTAQFLTAFGDNAVLFSLIAMIRQTADDISHWYIPLLQAAFLLSYVFFSPWTGNWADSHAKHRVLFQANIFKAGGVLLLFFGVEPLAAMVIIGTGSAIYAPAKYGILPDLVRPEHVVRLNGWVESSTILAIILGALVGARVADFSLDVAFVMVLILFIASALAAVFISSKKPQNDMCWKPRRFIEINLGLFRNSLARFALLGGVLFWSYAVVLRLLIVSWAPIALLIASDDTGSIAELTVWAALGVVIGSLMASRLISIRHIQRVRYYLFFASLMCVLLILINTAIMTKILLGFIGIAGGIAVVPINAVVQKIGHQTIGAGAAVAVQMFWQNTGMLLATLVYTLGSKNLEMNNLIIMVSLVSTALVLALCLIKLKQP